MQFYDKIDFGTITFESKDMQFPTEIWDIIFSKISITDMTYFISVNNFFFKLLEEPFKKRIVEEYNKIKYSPYYPMIGRLTFREIAIVQKYKKYNVTIYKLIKCKRENEVYKKIYIFNIEQYERKYEYVTHFSKYIYYKKHVYVANLLKIKYDTIKYFYDNCIIPDYTIFGNTVLTDHIIKLNDIYTAEQMFDKGLKEFVLNMAKVHRIYKIKLNEYSVIEPLAQQLVNVTTKPKCACCGKYH